MNVDINQLAQLLNQMASGQGEAPATNVIDNPQVADGIKAKHAKAETEGKNHSNDMIDLFENLGFEGVDLAFQLNGIAKNMQYAYFRARQEIERVAAREAMPSRFGESEDMTERRARAVANADASLIGFYAANYAVEVVYKRVASADTEAADVLVQYLKPIAIDEAAVSAFLAKQDAAWAERRKAQGSNARVAASTVYAATA